MPPPGRPGCRRGGRARPPCRSGRDVLAPPGRPGRSPPTACGSRHRGPLQGGGHLGPLRLGDRLELPVREDFALVRLDQKPALLTSANAIKLRALAEVDSLEVLEVVERRTTHCWTPFRFATVLVSSRPLR